MPYGRNPAHFQPSNSAILRFEPCDKAAGTCSSASPWVYLGKAVSYFPNRLIYSGSPEPGSWRARRILFAGSRIPAGDNFGMQRCRHHGGSPRADRNHLPGTSTRPHSSVVTPCPVKRDRILFGSDNSLPRSRDACLPAVQNCRWFSGWNALPRQKITHVRNGRPGEQSLHHRLQIGLSVRFLKLEFLLKRGDK
jgi:hypothetical protein